jgi:hypothetical protein
MGEYLCSRLSESLEKAKNVAAATIKDITKTKQQVALL